MPTHLNFNTPIDILTSTPHVLGYTPEPGRLVIHATHDGTHIFTASMETPATNTLTPQNRTELDSLTTIAAASGATSIIAIHYAHPNATPTTPITAYLLNIDINIDIEEILIVNTGNEYRSALDNNTAQWEPTPTPTTHLPTRNELLPNPSAPLDADIIASEWDHTRVLSIIERVNIAGEIINPDCAINETTAAVLNETMTRDWVIREIGRLAANYEMGKLRSLGNTILGAAMATPQPWASNLAAVAAAAYYCSGRISIELHTALDIASDGPSASLAKLIDKCTERGVPPEVWAEGLLTITDHAILKAGEQRTP